MSNNAAIEDKSSDGDNIVSDGTDSSAKAAEGNIEVNKSEQSLEYNSKYDSESTPENGPENGQENDQENDPENLPINKFRNFKINFTRAIIISIVLHIVAAVIYSIIIEPEPFDIPSVEVKIKIGSAGFSQIAPVVEKPKIKKTTPRKKSSNNTGIVKKKDRKKVRTSKKDANKNRNLEQQKELERQDELARKKRNKARKNDKLQNMPISKEDPSDSAEFVLVDELAKFEQENKKINKGADSRNTKNSLGEELGNKKDAVQTHAKDYEEKVSLWIGSKKFMPEHTIDKLRELNVFDDLFTSLYIKINRKGDILDMFVTESSGHDFIDNLTLEIATRATPLPRMPVEMTPNEDKFHFFITLKYPVTRWQKELRQDYKASTKK